MTPAALRHASGRQGQDGVRYRAERPEDHSAISEVVAAAFGSQAEAELVAEIRASEYFIAELSMVAQRDQRIIGHVMISHATLLGAESERRIAMLSPLAVDPAFQRRGIGSALVRTVTAEADTHGEPLVILEGSPRFYGRLGFEHSLRYGIDIPLPSWAPPEAAQVLRLSNYSPSLRGRVKYPVAFDRFAEE
jgi:putative acetyltransferase